MQKKSTKKKAQDVFIYKELQKKFFEFNLKEYGKTLRLQWSILEIKHSKVKE